MSSKYAVIEYGDRKNHRCRLPGTFRRWLHGIGLGARVRCYCGKEYRLTQWSEGEDWTPMPPYSAKEKEEVLPC